jgi:hypothetical protein
VSVLDAGCPYSAGPPCSGCDGGCWDSYLYGERQAERYPDACQGCWEVTGKMMVCDGTCSILAGVNSAAEANAVIEAWVRKMSGGLGTRTEPPL